MQRVGWVPIPKDRGVIAVLPDDDAYGQILPLLMSLRAKHERLTLFIVRPGGEMGADEMAEGIKPLRFPWNNRLSAILFLLTSRVRLIVAMGDPRVMPGGIARQAYALGIPMVVLNVMPSTAGGAIRSVEAAMIDWWLPANDRARWDLEHLGVGRDRIGKPDPLMGEAIADPAARFPVIAGLLARRPPLRRPIQALMAKALESPFWRRIVTLRAIGIGTLDELRARLKHPQTILCLGNGPSSEDPALTTESFDTLFRVNYRWLDRGFLTRPQVVFTGQKRTLFTLKDTIFAFQTRRAEAQLVAHQALNPFCGRMRFVTLQRLGILGQLDWDGVRPTNGATMVATAVALKPRKIIIAGIDLFEDPAGTYPGDSRTPNAYVPVHDRSLEIDFILGELAKFEGEIVIHGQALAQRWAQARRTGRQEGP